MLAEKLEFMSHVTLATGFVDALNQVKKKTYIFIPNSIPHPTNIIIYYEIYFCWK